METSLALLWLPILVAAVLVFVAGYILNMILPHHRTDFAKLPDEDSLTDAMRAQSVAQGQYVFPYASSPADLKDPAYAEKANKGPVGFVVVGPSGVGPTGKQLGTHFVYVLIISLIAAYVAGISLAPGSDYLKVFQITGCVAWLGYVGGLGLNSIWYHFSWSSTGKHILDGLIYGLLTAGTFGWLWP